MWKKTWSKMVATVIAVIMCFSCISAFAAEGNVPNEADAAEWIAILSTYNNLTLNSGGRLTCEGSTEVQWGYDASVEMDLQVLENGVWNSVRPKPWSGYMRDYIYLCQDWYVVKGTYRLKLTHKALTTSGSVLETVVKYSNQVTY